MCGFPGAWQSFFLPFRRGIPGERFPKLARMIKIAGPFKLRLGAALGHDQIFMDDR
jgi:hypothetical protein